MIQIINGLNFRVTLRRLTAFEEVSWPYEERASQDSLRERLESFPEGIFVLLDDGLPMAQFTIAPKLIPARITGFEQMRDLPVDRQSKTLWGTNLARRQGEEHSGKGYATMVVEAGLCWAREKGYETFMAGLTLDGLKESGLSLDEYVSANLNPAAKTFMRVGQKLGMKVGLGDPIANYWPTDENSMAYGQMITVYL